jgi:hypothetical protein
MLYRSTSQTDSIPFKRLRLADEPAFLAGLASDMMSYRAEVPPTCPLWSGGGAAQASIAHCRQQPAFCSQFEAMYVFFHVPHPTAHHSFVNKELYDHQYTVFKRARVPENRVQVTWWSNCDWGIGKRKKKRDDGCVASSMSLR